MAGDAADKTKDVADSAVAKAKEHTPDNVENKVEKVVPGDSDKDGA